MRLIYSVLVQVGRFSKEFWLAKSTMFWFLLKYGINLQIYYQKLQFTFLGAMYHFKPSLYRKSIKKDMGYSKSFRVVLLKKHPICRRLFGLCLFISFILIKLFVKCVFKFVKFHENWNNFVSKPDAIWNFWSNIWWDFQSGVVHILDDFYLQNFTENNILVISNKINKNKEQLTSGTKTWAKTCPIKPKHTVNLW